MSLPHIIFPEPWYPSNNFQWCRDYGSHSLAAAHLIISGLDCLGMTQGLLNSLSRQSLLAVPFHRRHRSALQTRWCLGFADRLQSYRDSLNMQQFTCFKPRCFITPMMTIQHPTHHCGSYCRPSNGRAALSSGMIPVLKATRNSSSKVSSDSGSQYEKAWLVFMNI